MKSLPNHADRCSEYFSGWRTVTGRPKGIGGRYRGHPGFLGQNQSLAVVAILLALILLAKANAHDLDGSVYCSRDGETRRLSDFGAVTPVWSPDGERICYVPAHP